jgi:hypothetical protein
MLDCLISRQQREVKHAFYLPDENLTSVRKCNCANGITGTISPASRSDMQDANVDAGVSVRAPHTPSRGVFKLPACGAE